MIKVVRGLFSRIAGKLYAELLIQRQIQFEWGKQREKVLDGDFYILEKKMGKWGKYKAKRVIYAGMERVLEKEKGRFFI